jgi:glycosyltransferase involved in cell wall biosynthesis
MIVSSAETPRPPVSAAIICLNEEANIGRCLDALAWCKDVVVVDSGSTDETLKIVRRHPLARVFHRPFDSYVKQKNHALDHCRHDWVLSVDADEVLSPALIEEIGGLPFDAAGYEIAIRPFLGGQEIKHGTWNPGYKLRLFRRSCGRWGGSSPHERVVLDGRTRRLKHRILHYSYQNREEFLERNRHYTRLMVDYLSEQGRATYFGEPAVHWLGNFFKSYVLRRGFLDGATGLFLAYHIANFSFMKYSLLAEANRSSTAPNTERVRASEHARGRACVRDSVVK